MTLLLVIITPGFFRSRACRAAVERFLARERELGRDDLILPVYYVSTPELEDETRRQADELACVLASRQYADWRDLRFKSFTSPVVQRAIAQLATRMRDSFWRLPAGKSACRGGSPAGPLPEAGRGGSPAGPLPEAGRGGSPAGPLPEAGRGGSPAGPLPEAGRGGSPAGPLPEAGRGGSPAGPLPEAGRGGSPAGPLARFVPAFKALFLIGSSRSLSAIVVRIAYYISLVLGAAWAATGISETISHFSVGYLIGAIALILVISVPIPWGLYKLATRLGRRA